MVPSALHVFRFFSLLKTLKYYRNILVEQEFVFLQNVDKDQRQRFFLMTSLDIRASTSNFCPNAKKEQKYVFTMNVMDILDICMLVQLFMGRKNKQKPQIHDIQYSLPWNQPIQFSAVLFPFQCQPLQRQKEKCYFRTSFAIPLLNTSHYLILCSSEILTFVLSQHIRRVSAYEKISL